MNLLHVDLSLRGCLQKGGVELTGQVVALILAHNPLILQVALVTHEDHWDLKTKRFISKN
jgi:hypothetical protein